MCIKIVSLFLDPSKTSSKRSVTFVADRTGCAAGTMTICQGRSQMATYHVSEHTQVPFPAPGFRLAKLAGGTDPDAGSYDVLVSPEDGHSCECKGWLRHGHCCHVDAVLDLVATGALDPDGHTFPDVAMPVDSDPDDDLPACFRNLGPSSLVFAFC